MAVRIFLSIIFSLLLNLGFGQETLKYRWAFDRIENLEGTSLLPIDSTDYFQLREDSTFRYQLKAKDNLIAEGTWIQRNDSLILNYTLPADTTRFYKLITANDTLLAINEGPVNFTFRKKPTQSSVASSGLPVNYDFTGGSISMASLARGILGISVLVFLGFLFSSKKRKINWLLVIKGLIIQVLFALAILKVPAVRVIFDFLSEKFVTLLGFTREGAEFLFGGLITNTESLG